MQNIVNLKKVRYALIVGSLGIVGYHMNKPDENGFRYIHMVFPKQVEVVDNEFIKNNPLKKPNKRYMETDLCDYLYMLGYSRDYIKKINLVDTKFQYINLQFFPNIEEVEISDHTNLEEVSAWSNQYLRKLVLNENHQYNTYMFDRMIIYNSYMCTNYSKIDVKNLPKLATFMINGESKLNKLD